MASNRMPEISRNRAMKFWRSVDIKCVDDCWEWSRVRDVNGYGRVCFGPRGGVKAYTATRVAYFLTFGVDPAALFVLHKCDNPPCVNPTHLFLGTKQDNTTDCINKKRFPVGEDYGKVLSSVDVYMMREMWLSGLYSQRKIGKLYGTSPEVARRAIAGINWSHIPMPPGVPPKRKYRLRDK